MVSLRDKIISGDYREKGASVGGIAYYVAYGRGNVVFFVCGKVLSK